MRQSPVTGIKLLAGRSHRNGDGPGANPGAGFSQKLGLSNPFLLSMLIGMRLNQYRKK